MTSALLQSRAPWLPDVQLDASLADVVATLPRGGTRIVLDAFGSPIASEELDAPVTLAVGPEGGLEAAELETLHAAGFRAVSLGANVLRFETAAVAGLAIVRSMLSVSTGTTNG